MKKQVFRAVTMFVGIITLALASALAASAQNSRSLVVNIPFDFTLAGKTLPAGEYIVTRASENGPMTLAMKRKDGKANAIALAKSIEADEIQGQSRLIFNRYGERYFLSQVWTAGDATGRELYRNRQERALEVELAKNNLKVETIALVFNAR